jgi:hypothetical protein
MYWAEGFAADRGPTNRRAYPAPTRRPDLTRLFAAAIRPCGSEASEIDGETAFLADGCHLAELMQ